MQRNHKSAWEVMDEKYEDRGWGKYNMTPQKSSFEPVEPLEYSENEYRKLAVALAAKAIETQDASLCEAYFELQRRASFGNHYSSIPELEEIEEELFTMGTREKSPEVEVHRR